MTLFTAIKRAGGIGWDGGNSVVEIRRGIERIRIKLRELAKKPQDAPKLQPGDLLVVDPEPETRNQLTQPNGCEIHARCGMPPFRAAVAPLTTVGKFVSR